MTQTEQLDAAYKVLTETPMLKDLIKEHKIGSEEIAGIIERLQKAQKELKAEEDAVAIAQIEAILTASKLDRSLLSRFIPTPVSSERAPSESSTDVVSKRTVKPKWYRFEYEGNEYFINRSPSGQAKGALAAYMTLVGKKLTELEVKESDVNHDRVITKEQHDELTSQS